MGKKYTHISISDRETIARLRATGLLIREIAATIHRSPSSISREIKQNQGANGARKKIMHKTQLMRL